MKNKYSWLIIFALLGAQNLEAASSTTKDAADYLVEVGEMALRGGNAQDAIHEFSKALMIDPDHQEAKAYLRQFGLKAGIYTGAVTRESRLADLAHGVRRHKKDINKLQEERTNLERRVMLLEDVMERKGDHKLLKDIEDYYRYTAMYEIDETLPEDQQLLALKRKHKDFQEYAFDKDRIQEKYVDVMEELLHYREAHLEDARNDVLEHKIALAENRKELLVKMDRLKRLRQEFDTYRHSRYYDEKEVEHLENVLSEANYQLEMLLDNRRILLHRLHQHTQRMREVL